MFHSSSRVLVIAAHPDDDILGCGGTLARLRHLGCEVRVVFVGEGISPVLILLILVTMTLLRYQNKNKCCIRCTQFFEY